MRRPGSGKNCSIFDKCRRRGAPTASAPANVECRMTSAPHSRHSSLSFDICFIILQPSCIFIHARRIFIHFYSCPQIGDFWQGSEPCQSFFICKGRFFILDLERFTIDRQISVFPKIRIVFRPFLPVHFSNQLFKDFAFIVFAFLYYAFKVFNRAKDFRAVGEKKRFLCDCGIEADRIALTAACGVKSENQRENFRRRFYKVHIAFEDESENVQMSEAESVILFKKRVEEREVFHLCNSFRFCSLDYVYIILPPETEIKNFY